MNSSESPSTQVERAFALTECLSLQPMIDFLVERLGFRLERISPADDPQEAEVVGAGLRLLVRRRSEAGALNPGGPLRVVCSDPAAAGLPAGELTAPNGLRVEVVEPEGPLTVPALRPQTVVSRAGDDWITGRAGMSYRDLIPGRLGGHSIASNIRVEQAGPVPDYVHYHAIRFQMIYCSKGWVRLVYEDQGEPFVLEAGDCVLQPPEIRHRVLESSAGLEVVEIASPARHDTFVEHAMELPNGTINPDREFSGQRFVRSQSQDAVWLAEPDAEGFTRRSLGIHEATRGIASADLIRAPKGATRTWRHGDELGMLYVTSGVVRLGGIESIATDLGPNDSLVLPANVDLTLTATEATEYLEVRA